MKEFKNSSINCRRFEKSKRKNLLRVYNNKIHDWKVIFNFVDYKIGIDEIYLTIENKVYQFNYLFSFILKESKYSDLYQTL